jgi:hypothetical protein
MHAALSPHPESRRAGVAAIEADIARAGAAVTAQFTLHGDLGALRLPAPAPAAHADGLWRTTCFEAFLQPGEDSAYFEFNFSPSSQWAAYRFDAYRAGMAPLKLAAAPRIATERAGDRLTLTAALALAEAGDLVAAARWRIGLCAVIEDETGALGYWALAHAPGKPDFHHSETRILTLAEAP